MSHLRPIHFFLGLLLALGLLAPYEYYWRVVEHYPPSYDLESLDHWADERSKAEDLSSEDVLILGSSRAHFDLNIHLWDTLTGRRPLQLAYPGSSPFHPVTEIVNNTEFAGLLVIGVSPGLFFTTADSWGANRGKAFVDQYHERTYAEQFNQWLYYYIDPHFAYLEEGLTLEAMLERPLLPNRDSIDSPPVWPPMVAMSRDRNIRMTSFFETDTTLQRRQKDIWFNPDPKNRYVEQVDTIFAHYIGLVEKFKARGGRIAFIRPPITGYYVDTESKLYPRAEYWDRLIEECDCPGYHYADHEVSAVMNPPEWSHLNRKESDLYTRLIIEKLKNDELL